MKALVLYYTRTGITQKMAETISKALKEEGIETDLVEAKDFSVDKLPEYQIIVVGSPTYYGTMAAEIKQILDESVRLHGKLDGKIGGAFTSSANVAGGNETTIWSILSALLIHGMIVKGIYSGNHYGPVAVGSFEEDTRRECIAYAKELAKLGKTLTKERQ
ncbi:MAG: flavodoxin domain-containing protein [Candidatus Atribacteria bacterium]|nr:flavodoxin domain-containing protein [Candidatus Atribacteria bacterium]MCD6350466.1 flavodoxin domain-containing protein [Candidatus Atribacteria bacterium]